jgi:hypothetical protein
MTRLEQGQAALIARQQRASAVTTALTYTRVSGGGTVNLTGKAWVGRTVFRRNPLEAGAAIEFGDRDYLIPVADLPAEPERGDRITQTVGATQLVFELIAPANEPAWRYSDPMRTLYRVHVKQVQTE